MGVLQRFERRLEGLVEGAFAKTFKSNVEPVEVAKALRREAVDHKVISASRSLVPNTYTVELSAADHEHLEPYAAPLGVEFAGILRETAAEEGWAFVGPVTVGLERHDDLDQGVFRVRSKVVPVPRADSPQEPSPRSYDGPVRHRLVVLRRPGDADGPAAEQRDLTLDRPVTVLGRAGDVDLSLADTGVSRRHAEVRLTSEGTAELRDLGSTNGTNVNGRRVERVRLRDGDHIALGRVEVVYRREASG